MNKKLLLIALLCSATIMAKAPDLAGTDIDGCSDSEDTLYAFWKELRNANKKQPEPVTPQTNPDKHKPVIKEPAYTVVRKQDTTTLTAQLEAKKQALAEANTQRTTLSEKLREIDDLIIDLYNDKKSPLLTSLRNMGAGTVIAGAAEYIAQETKLPVPPGATFAALEIATIVYEYYSNQRVKNFNQEHQNGIEQLVKYRHSTALLYVNAVSESQALQEEIARLEQELAQQN